MKTELLAPAKNKEVAFSAIDCGADAIYIGAPNFGARKNASNSLEDIKEIINYAHKFWVKVFVTVNTILTDNELDEAVELVIQLTKIKVDAIIIQDMGLLEKLIELQNTKDFKLPQIHISTQCDNRNVEKVKFFKDMGVTRVVLARELSLDKIKEIHQSNPNLELEAFVHGALCVSYSGQCYLSQYIGGRSANRGECAQPCRKKYTVKTKDGEILAKEVHALCLKDFNASSHLKTMAENGIFSFKIEGRLKDVNYVKNVVSYYRKELDKFSEKISSGTSFPEFEPNPQKSFNRGFTDYFLEKRKDCFNFLSPKSRGEYLGEVVSSKENYFILKTNKKINPQDGLSFQDGGFLVNKIEGNKIFPNKKITLPVKTKIFRNLDVVFEEQLQKPTKRLIKVNISIKDKIVIKDEDDVKIEISLPSGEIAQNQEKMNETFIKQFSKVGEECFYIENLSLEKDVPFLPISEINQLRRTSFAKLVEMRLSKYSNKQQSKLSHTQFYKKELDYRANVHNAFAKEFYEKSGAKVLEMSLETKIPKREVELMRTKHCIKYALNMCKSPKQLVLEDDCGQIYPLKFDCNNCEMQVLSYKILKDTHSDLFDVE